MDNEQTTHNSGKTLYDLVERTEAGSASYQLYSKDDCYRMEILVLDDGQIREARGYQVNSDGHPYPDALSGDHDCSNIPDELKARAADLTAVLAETPLQERTALPQTMPEISSDHDVVQVSELSGVTERQEMRDQRGGEPEIDSTIKVTISRSGRARGHDRER